MHIRWLTRTPSTHDHHSVTQCGHDRVGHCQVGRDYSSMVILTLLALLLATPGMMYFDTIHMLLLVL